MNDLTVDQLKDMARHHCAGCRASWRLDGLTHRNGFHCTAMKYRRKLRDIASKARETEARAREFSRLLQLRRTRYVITFNLAGSYNPATGRYDKAYWPILFRSLEEADLALKTLPIFANSAAMPGRGRIKSACIEKRLIPDAP